MAVGHGQLFIGDRPKKMDAIFHRRHCLDLLVDSHRGPSPILREPASNKRCLVARLRQTAESNVRNGMFLRGWGLETERKNGSSGIWNFRRNARRFSGSVCGWKTASAASGLTAASFQENRS